MADRPSRQEVARNRAGCLVLLLIIGGVTFVMWQNQERQRSDDWNEPTATEDVTTSGLDPVVREQHELLLDEQAQAAREQTRRLYEERIELRRQRILLISERLERDGEREYDKLILVNRCPHEIAVAVNYADLDGKWIVRGWWNVKAGDEVTTDAMTKSDTVYFYAENTSEGWIFDGTNRQGSRSLSVVNDRFDYLEGETFLYENPTEKSFYPATIPKDAVDYTETFECNPEARDAAGTAPAAK